MGSPSQSRWHLYRLFDGVRSKEIHAKSFQDAEQAAAKWSKYAVVRYVRTQWIFEKDVKR